MNKLVKKKILKIVSVIVIISLLHQIAFPSIVLALTNGYTQPEVWDYQPVGATDNVSLLTGAFSYTIPVTSVPEYPMAIGYRSGIKPDQEAGMFGLGFHGFSGAIGRNLLGIPDDVNGADRVYRFLNQKRWNISLGASVGTSYQIPGVSEYLSVGGNVSISVGYDNYTGVFGSVGFGLGVGITGKSADIGSISGKNASLNIGVSAGIGLVSDSRSQRLAYGYGAGASAGISTVLNNDKIWNPVDADLIGYSAGGFIGDKPEEVDGGYLISKPGITNFSNTSSSSIRSLPPTANVTSWIGAGGVSFSVPLPIEPPITVNMSYSAFNVLDKSLSKKAFGFKYLNNYDKRNDEHICDMTIEGENPFPELKEGNPDPRSNPNYLQRDYFMVNAMGISGTMQLNQLKYGVASRNYSRFTYRDIGLLQLKTKRQQVYPWASVNEAEFNKSIDILKVLKSDNPEDRDFDRVFFREKEISSLTSEEYSFNDVQFKMRGDLTGEFNQASKKFNDYHTNDFKLVKIAGGQEKKGLLRSSKKIPLYKPEFAGSSNVLKNFDDELEYGTSIKYETIGEILQKNSNLIAQYNSHYGRKKRNFELNQNMYSHYTYEKTGNKKDNVILNENLAHFSSLMHLVNMSSADKEYFSSLIGSIEIKNATGLKYVFGLPVFAKKSETMQLSGKGVLPPKKKNDTDYCSFKKNNGNPKDRSKVNIQDEYSYPYAWLLTAIVGEDYIDFDNIPGPSDGDIGFWVKFRYAKVADDYCWRVPFTGLEHLPGAIHTADDDAYSMATGEKEIYVLSEIESSGYVCKYNYQKRYDGLDAKGRYNGKAINVLTTAPLDINQLDVDNDPTGDNFQFVVTSIDLYKKHYNSNNSETRSMDNPYGKKIKSTLFEYDYSLCPGVPNNLTNYPGYDIKKRELDYIYNNDLYPEQNIGTGKLTLRKVQHVAYDEAGGATYLPSYTFSYWPDADTKYNPSFDDKQVDRWGNYSKRTKAEGEILTQINYYQHYCEYDKEIADENAKVYGLKSIYLPSGGKLDVEFEAQDYGYVEDKKPYVMRNVKQGFIQQVVNGDSKNTEVYVDVTDICNEELKQGKTEANLEGLNWKYNVVGYNSALSPGDTVYGQIAFYQQHSAENPASEDKLFIAATKAVAENITDIVKENDRYYQKIEVKAIDDKDNKAKFKNPPFIFECKNYLYNSSLQMRALKEKLLPSCNNTDKVIKRYEELEKDDPITAVKKVVANLRNVFVGNDLFESEFIACYNEPATVYYPHLSFIRTPVFKAKYTGTRVKAVTYFDRFSYATKPDGSVDENETTGENVYGSRYYYDNNSDGTGRSSFVATIEPGGGDAAVIDVHELVGAGFAPSPAIISSKTTLESVYADTDGADNIQSRKKGKR